MDINVFDTGYGVNTYLLVAGSDALIIDPGCGLEEVFKFVSERKITVRAILLTHGHFDHTGGVKSACDRFKCKAYMSSADLGMLEKTDFTFSDFGEPIKVLRFTAEPIDETTTLNFSGLPTIKVIETPGHTPGGVCYVVDLEGVLFSGDTLFRYGYGRTDFRFADEQAMIKSLKKLVNLDKDYKVYTGHGAPTSISEARCFLTATLGI